MPKYLLLINEREADYDSSNEAQFNEVMAMHSDFAKAVAESGATMLGGEALLPVATATYLRGTRTDAVHTVDNPAPELKEVLGGYYLIEAEDEATARKVAELCPAPYGHSELRPIWDFGA
jgi:hypothetical protein